MTKCNVCGDESGSKPGLRCGRMEPESWSGPCKGTYRMYGCEMEAAISKMGAVYDVCYTLQYAGHEAVVVGGSVRDLLLGVVPHDWDVATSCGPTEVKHLFRHTISVGEQYGTVIVVVDGEHIEVTTFRADGIYTDGRHPDYVKMGVTLGEDLSRRDFTMNALALDPISGVLTDHFGGRKDIEARLIRAVGDPNRRFHEDGLRMMRAVRFAATLGFELEQGTRVAMRNSLGFLDGVSAERLRDELVKLMTAEEPSVGLRLAALTGLLWKVIPELAAGVRHPQNSHHNLDIWQHVMLTVDSLPPDPILRMGGLLHDVAKPACAVPAYGPGQFSFHGHAKMGAEVARDIMERLKFSNKDRDRVVHMVRHHMALFGYRPELSDKAIRKIVKKVGAESLPDIIQLSFADVIAKGWGEDPEVYFEGVRERLWGIMAEIANGGAVEKSQLAVNGKEVMDALDLDPGPQVGEVLQYLLDLVVDDPKLNDKNTLLNLSLNWQAEKR